MIFFVSVCTYVASKHFWFRKAACSLLWNLWQSKINSASCHSLRVYAAKKLTSRKNALQSNEVQTTMSTCIGVVSTPLKAKGPFFTVTGSPIRSLRSRVINSRVKRKSPQMRLNTVWKMIRNPSAQVLIPLVRFLVTHSHFLNTVLSGSCMNDGVFWESWWYVITRGSRVASPLIPRTEHWEAHSELNQWMKKVSRAQ